MLAIPRSLDPAVPVVAIGAHALGVVRPLFVSAVVHLSSEYGKGGTSFWGGTWPREASYGPWGVGRGVLGGGFPSLAFVC
jgi:hypothetical protein